ncbi:unnamed protein product [Miscanthus lutarioriparius]|uniref:Dirigent protein n=1 Tax=Miscanthus lutarioriparius TaxID=422564 RepID=A0A811MSV2_9POAL|nr:unnamed protein product [Miscanthus lutarioriparius]
MLARIIFCVVIAAAVLLATVSPLPHRSGGQGAPGQQRTFTVYIHPTASTAVQQEQQVQERRRGASALVSHHRMTAGPESASTIVGAASGFLPPAGERGAAASVFDTVHLAFDGGAGLSGSLCVETSDEKARRGGRRRHNGEEEVLRVVGGTGAFAFARGRAVLRGQRPHPGATAAALLLELSVSSAES